MKHLINFEEFVNSKIETSNFRIPFAAVEPPPNDKIHSFVKNVVNKSPLWGINAKKQEKENKIKGNR